MVRIGLVKCPDQFIKAYPTQYDGALNIYSTPCNLQHYFTQFLGIATEVVRTFRT